MTLLEMLFVSIVISVAVIKADCSLTGKVKEFNFEVEIPNTELKAQVQQILDATNEINKKLDDVKSCTCTRFQGAVFHVANGRYTYNFEDAKKACKDHGAQIATLAQLQAAWSAGLDVCKAGWLADGSVRYPIRMPRTGCGHTTPAGVRSWGYKPKTKKSADAYCYKA
ncbi:hyaluronan and proteoglycan link protein 1-like [Anneissia japonica]|uniref:hyaluronan and proteoglycan link protein 1-like n=1 Tax=Anneissia japonica TaxID=1529436 RepID=UPI0014259EC9|nr:hyaluronan and proteoglycan link protein 1-like [Anneissia japonica]